MNMPAERSTTVVWPTLRYEDAQGAIGFLVDAFGFEKVAVYTGDDPTVVDHAELRWPGGGGVMLGSVRQDSSTDQIVPGTGSVYIVTDDPDGLYDRARRAGATIS